MITEVDSDMALLGNILWFVLGGWALFLAYALAAVVFFPFFIPLFRLALYAAWPFGRSVVTRSELERYRKLEGLPVETSAVLATMRGASALLNIVWLLTFGWILALLHVVCSIANIFFIWMIVTIPNIPGHWKLIPVAFMPFNKVIVPVGVASEIRDALSRNRLGLR